MSALKKLSSEQLLARLFELVQRSSALEADLLEHLAEVDARSLYLREGCSSMFAYCVRALRFAEGVAYKRIAAARVARRHPDLLLALRSGELHLTAVSLLAPQLTVDNAAELIAAARYRTADEIRRLLADRKPEPCVDSCIRKIPDGATRVNHRKPEPSVVSCVGEIPDGATRAYREPEAGLISSACNPPISSVSTGEQSLQSDHATDAPRSLNGVPRRRAADATAPPPRPLGQERYAVRFTANRELHAQLRELQALMRHQIPDGDLGKILARAVGVLLKQVRSRKYAECSTPRAAAPTGDAPSRHIPAAIRRAVARRDGERCAFVSETGRRCDSRDFLEFHHCDPWARTRSHAIEDISLRCRAHNRFEAERDFGTDHMNQFRSKDRSGPTPPAQDSNVSAIAPSQLDLDPVGSRNSWPRHR